MSAPVTGAADVEIVQVSTGQVLALPPWPWPRFAGHLLRRAGGCLLNGGFYQAAVLNQITR